MTSHTFHPDISICGLATDCERCHEHATRPWISMDKDNLARIARGDLRSSLDRIAHQNLLEHYGHDLEAVLQEHA